MNQSQALAILKTGANIFLTGEPGSGKTHTINTYIEYLRSQKIQVAITASTGIAATHIGGMTIHAWSGIGIKTHLTKSDISKILNNSRRAKRIQKARVLIIEEVSMLAPNTISMVDMVCRAVRKNTTTFGGVQVVFVGDFFQLPPVVRVEISHSNQEQFLDAPITRFAYDSPSWQKAAPVICYLTQQYRQDDQRFLALLTAIRSNTFSNTHADIIRTRGIITTALPPDIPKLYSHNADVDSMNTAILMQLAGETKTFTMITRGPAPITEALQRGCLSPSELVLKVGAVVMFTKNSQDGRYVNGTLGTVIGFGKDTGFPIIKSRSGKVIEEGPVSWTVEEGDRVVAEIIQVPLRLAWAITIHKSQGMTLDAAAMDLSHVFEYGQGYVALSRVRSLSGLHLLGWNARAFEVHPAILAKDQEFRTASAAIVHTIPNIIHHPIVSKSDGFAKIRSVYPSAYRPWDKSQDQKLVQLSKTGEPISALMKIFGRNRGAILSRLAKLGM